MKPRAAVISLILALGLLLAPALSPGQPPGKVYRIGYLSVSAAGNETDPQHCWMRGQGTRRRGRAPERSPAAQTVGNGRRGEVTACRGIEGGKPSLSGMIS